MKEITNQLAVINRRFERVYRILVWIFPPKNLVTKYQSVTNMILSNRLNDQIVKGILLTIYSKNALEARNSSSVNKGVWWKDFRNGTKL